MNPGDRVTLHNLRPEYLNGIRATVVREQPGEARTLVRVDRDPKARKYAGGEWCVQTFTLRPDDSTDPLFALIRDKIDPACRSSAARWMEDIARLVNGTADDFLLKNFGGAEGETTKAAMLWRFYWHLSNELRLISEGHETVMFTSLKEER